VYDFALLSSWALPFEIAVILLQTSGDFPDDLALWTRLDRLIYVVFQLRTEDPELLHRVH